MSLLLSVLDLSPLSAGSSGAQALRNSVDLARHVDGLGFHRYWVSEHHNLPSVVSSSPEVLIGHLAQASRRMRVGSGGIMLPNHAPLRIAEAFRVLEALHPGRIDLGLGRAPGSDGRAALALRRGRSNGDDFPELFDELLAFGGLEPFPAGSPLSAVRALPDDVPLPPVWLLGSSDWGARFAAQRGFGYAFAHHFSAEWVYPATQAYKEGFRPSSKPGRLAKSHLILTVSALCAPTDAEADRLAGSLDLMAVRRARGKFLPIASPDEAAAYPFSAEEREFVADFREKIFVGSPATVRRKLEALAAETGADELMVNTMVWDHAARKRSYALLAEAFGLSSARETFPVPMRLAA